MDSKWDMDPFKYIKKNNSALPNSWQSKDPSIFFPDGSHFYWKKMVNASVLFESITYDDDDCFVYLRLFCSVFFVEQLEGPCRGVCSVHLPLSHLTFLAKNCSRKWHFLGVTNFHQCLWFFSMWQRCAVLARLIQTPNAVSYFRIQILFLSSFLLSPPEGAPA